MSTDPRPKRPSSKTSSGRAASKRGSRSLKSARKKAEDLEQRLIERTQELQASQERLADVQRIASETILVAEDDEDLRELVTEFLESQGYRVLSGTDGRDALRIALEHTGSIDLLVTDVMMPFMVGPELAKHMLRERPGLRVLFMSGYVGEFAQPAGAFGPNAVLLRKPFSLDALARAVRECLASAT
jgi:CheY-like chemotaxis protein